MVREEPLYRGNDDDVAGRPDPGADDNLVRHVLYLGGRGRASPYLSITAARDEPYFGKLWETTRTGLDASGAKHISNDALLAALKRNRGRSKWGSVRDRQRAYKYAEQHGEQLADFSGFGDAEQALAAVTAAFAGSA